MNKLVLFLLISVFVMMLQAVQWDHEMAVYALFRAKHALNRATHAAAQQLDLDRLPEGVHAIDEAGAWRTALEYLRGNLQLDEQLRPLPGSFLRAEVEVLEWKVVNADEGFPYVHDNAGLDYRVTLHRPGVIMVILVQYPRTFRLLGPTEWELKGVSELVVEPSG